MKKSALALGAMLLAGALTWGTAQAMPISSGAPTALEEAHANIETVGNRRGGHRYWRHGGHHRNYGWRHNRHHGDDLAGYGGVFLGGVLLGSALADGYDDYDDYDDYPRYRYDDYPRYRYDDYPRYRYDDYDYDLEWRMRRR